MNKTDAVLENIYPSLIKTLDKSRRGILTRAEMQQLIVNDLTQSNLNQRAITTSKVINYLWERKQIKEVTFAFPSRKETRFIFGDITKFEIAQSLKPNAYLVYRAAMCIHKLINECPDIIYINVEQSTDHQRNRTSLTQEAIDRAFKSTSRISNEVAFYEDIGVCVTHGQKTDRSAVINRRGPSGEILLVTDLERTLIDISVRPVYAGGPSEVLKAFREARDLISIDKLAKILAKMDYVYPYHQVIGFYLEHSKAYKNSDLRAFEKIPKEFTFYLDYKMDRSRYDKRWNIYYPKDLLN